MMARWLKEELTYHIFQIMREPDFRGTISEIFLDYKTHTLNIGDFMKHFLRSSVLYSAKYGIR
jgi:hypothetical protein